MLVWQLLLSLAEDSNFMARPDSVGATPILALLVSNTNAALALCNAIFDQESRVQYIVYRLRVQGVGCVVHTAYCTLHTAHCTLHTAYCY